jgi:phage tail-like protein
MPGGSPGDFAITASRFSITVDGVEIASFSELGKITSEAPPDDLAGRVLKKLPGKRTPPTVTLVRGMTSDLGIFAWHQSVLEGQATSRKDAVLVMFSAAGEPVAKYHLASAWPSMLVVEPSKAGSHDVLVETVTLMCDRLERIAP